MKRLRLLLTMLAALLLLQAGAAAVYLHPEIYQPDGTYRAPACQDVSLTFDGAALETDVPAFILDGRTLVPIRVISEALSAEVSWRAETREAVIEKDGKTIVLTIGSAEAVVDGASVTLPDSVPASLVRFGGANRTMVPLRFVSEQFGCSIEWDAATRTAAISSPEPPAVRIAPPSADDSLLTIETGGVLPNAFSLSGRYVIDLPGCELRDSLGGVCKLDSDQLLQVRFSQYDGRDYAAAHTVRVVLDLRDGVAPSDLAFQREDGCITLPLTPMPQPEETPEETPDETPDETPGESPEGNPDETPEESPDEMPDDAPEDKPEELPGETPEVFYPSSLPISNIYNINITDRKLCDDGRLIICLDAGHGGYDPGCLNADVYEKNITLAIVKKLGAMLEADGVSVVYTRRDNTFVSLSDRVRIANRADADLFISVHVNSCATPSVSGIETYYWSPEDAQSKALARSVQSYLIGHTNAVSRSIKTADYTVIHHTAMPAILTEVGFISNLIECGSMATDLYQTQLATGIYTGIRKYLDAAGVEIPAAQ